MNTNIISILEATFDAGTLVGNQLIRDLPFDQYQTLPGVNASLLKQPTSYEMAAYAAGIAALDSHERALAELTGANVSDILERVEQTTPRTVPVKTVALARNVVETDKLSTAQQDVVNALRQSGPLDSREFKAATLTALDSKGIIEWEDTERSEVTLSPTVRESRALALTIGDTVHKAILEPNLFDAGEWQKHWQLSPSKGLTTKDALDAAAEDPTRQLITPEIIDTARRCRDAVWKHKLAAELLTQPGSSEVTAQAWDEQAMCWRKARFDRLPNDPAWGIVDIKTTHTGLSHQQLKGAMYKFAYNLQSAYYLDTLSFIEPKPRDHFHLIFVTKEAPFLARCVEVNTAPMEDSFVARGRETYLDRLAMFSVAWFDKAWEAYENEPLTTLRA
jgi:hypothetical protein